MRKQSLAIPTLQSMEVCITLPFKILQTVQQSLLLHFSSKALILWYLFSIISLYSETLAMKGLILNCMGKQQEAQECVKRGLMVSASVALSYY